jgi:hypothetical protein
MSDVTPTVAAPDPSRRGARRLVPVTVLLVVAVVTAVVGVASSRSSAAELVNNALTSSLSASSITFTESLDVSTPAGDTVANEVGGCDIASYTCEISLNYAGVMSVLGTIQVEMAGGQMYMKFPAALASKFPTPWVSLPFNMAAFAPSSMYSAESPISSMQEMTQAGATVTDGGAVVVDGQSLHLYRVVFSPSAASALLAKGRQKLPAWMRSFTSADVTYGGLSYDIYLDGSGTLARTSMRVGASISGEAVTTTITADITGYGVPVVVTVPAADQVTPLLKLMAGTSGGGLLNGVG